MADGPRRGLSPTLGRVGPYEISDLLGQGGMAAVYLARDTRDDSEVAVKVLARMRPSWVQRFSREFDAARRVNHPNVVKVLEAGEADGVAYYSMERVHGATAIRHVLDLGAEEPLPPPPPMERSGEPVPLSEQRLRRTLEVAIQLCRAVAAINDVGLVHRDLKPGNVLVTHDGVVKLVDFGVAKWLEEQTSFTQVGHVVGSYSYMSPEQITGAQVDHRADMYGMGILLYELLSGAPPFRARRPQEYLWLHCTAQPEPLSRIHTDVPAELDSLLLRMLAKEPADRPESMRAVERDLLNIQAEVEGEAAGASMEEIVDDDSHIVVDLLELDLPDGEEHTLRSQDPRLAALRANARGAGVPDEATARLSDADVQALRRPRPPIADDSTQELPSRRAVLEQAKSKRGRTATASTLAAMITPRHVGRQAELDALIAHLKASRKEGVRLVLVEGEEGIGKTRLLHAFRGLAWVKGARVAIGRCHRAGGAFCAPFHDVLLRLAGPGLARSHSDRVLGADRALLTRFFPVLGDGVPALDPVGSQPVMAQLGGEKEDLAALFRALADVLRRAARDAPIVLAIEDLQWADEGTLRALGSLVRRLAPPRPAGVLLLATYRSEDLDDATTPVAAAVSSLRTLPAVHSTHLKPLSAEDVAELIRSVTVDVAVEDEIVRRLADASDGNPRFAVEVARNLVESGGAQDASAWDAPSTLMAAYGQRLKRLSKSARDVARCLALIGGTPPLSIVEAASALSADAFAGATNELERRRVLEVDRRGEEDTAELHSEALRTALLDSLSATDARALHRRAAAAWLKQANRRPDATSQAARHLFAAGEKRAAFPHALEAAYRAGESLDLTTTRRWMLQIGDPGPALDAVSPAAVYRYHLLRFLLAFNDGDLPTAEEAVGKAADAAPDSRSRLTAGVSCARLHTRRGDYVSAVRVARQGLRDASANGADDLALLFALQGARAARRSGDFDSALAWLAEADILLASSADLENMAVRAAWTRSAVLLEKRREEEAEQQIVHAIALARDTAQERAEAGLRTNLSVLLFRRGDMEQALEEVITATRIFEEMGERDQVALNKGNLSELHLLRGHIDQASELAMEAWNAFRRLRDRQGVLTAAAHRLAVARARQDVGEAEGLLERMESIAGPDELEASWAVWWLERAKWHRSRQQKSVAWHCLEQAARSLGPDAPEHRKREVNLVRGELMVDREQFARALPILKKVVEQADEDGHQPIAWRARCVLTAVEARLGREVSPLLPPDKLLRHHVPLSLATSWYLGEAFSYLQRPDEAQALREEGAELAQSLGFLDWVGVFARPRG